MSDATKAMQEVIRSLKEELARLRAIKSGSYRLRMADVADLGKAYQEIAAGDAYGLRRLEDILESLDPRWRDL